MEYIRIMPRWLKIALGLVGIATSVILLTVPIFGVVETDTHVHFVIPLWPALGAGVVGACLLLMGLFGGGNSEEDLDFSHIPYADEDPDVDPAKQRKANRFEERLGRRVRR